MLRIAARFANTTVKNTMIRRPAVAAQNIRAAHGETKTDEQIDEEYIKYFNRPDIDGWEIRKAITDMSGMDFVPEPPIICAALRACRRLNDHALAVRYLESVKYKCGSRVDEIYPYILQEIRPTLDELGISTPEELGFDKPELALESVYDMH